MRETPKGQAWENVCHQPPAGTRLMPNSSPSSSSSGNTSLWDIAWSEMQPNLSSLRSTIASWPRPTPRILRVGQLDAELLDQELVNLLKEPVNKAFGQLGVRSCLLGN